MTSHNGFSEETPIKVTYTYCLPQHKEELQMASDAPIYLSALQSIDNHIRSIMKNSNNEDVLNLCEDLIDILCEVAIWD